MKKTTTQYDNACIDSDGYATMLVQFGEWCVPVKAKKLKLNAADVDVIHENLWNVGKFLLKDIPKIAEIVGNLVDDNEELLYWSSSSMAWKFCNDAFSGIDDDSDEAIDRLNVMIDNLYFDNKLFCLRGITNAVYTDEEIAEAFGQTCKPSVVDELLAEGAKHLKARAISKMNLAKHQHKKIPYADIGKAVVKAIESMSYAEIGKMLVS